MTEYNYCLSLITPMPEGETKFELRYYGNENIFIEAFIGKSESVTFEIPRNTLEKFLEMINGT